MLGKEGSGHILLLKGSLKDIYYLLKVFESFQFTIFYKSKYFLGRAVYAV